MSAPGETVQASRPSAAQLLAGASIMFLCAALVDLWFFWPAGAEMDAYEYLVYLAVIGTFTVLWYSVLLMTFPRLQRHGAVAGFVTGVFADISLALLAAVAYWASANHEGSPSANAILGIELAYAFAYLAVFLIFVSWRVLLVYAAGGWLAQQLIRRARSQP